MDPTINFTYEVVEAIIREMTDIFPDASFHLGGDEIWPDCWLSNSRIIEWMNEHGMEGNNTRALIRYYLDNVNQILIKYHRQPVYWQEVWGMRPAFHELLVP